MASSVNLLHKTSSTSRLLSAARRATSRNPRKNHRAASTLQCEVEADDPIPHFQIFDIFDAPSRLGESSKILARSRTPSSPSTSSLNSHTVSSLRSPTPRQIEPLPMPIIYDGPARPRHLSMMSYRVGRDRSSLNEASKLSQEVSTLPDPILFDGPSRLRPYIRGSSTSDSQSVGALSVIIRYYHSNVSSPSPLPQL